MSLILFDMDGTLTPARKEMSYEMAHELCKLSLQHRIGIVTGSGLDYLLEQTKALSEPLVVNPENFHMMPCNGTKWYTYDSRWKLNLRHEVSMIEDGIGIENYKKLITFIVKKTHEIFETPSAYGFDLIPTGTFVQYRGSMLNWCPIGRDAGDMERKAFVKLDTRVNLRETLRNELINYIDFPLEVALGGSTSLDIYPPGWDKTYCLRHFKDGKEAWFVGDKCVPPGNDSSIFEACVPRSFITTSPKETLKIIRSNFRKLEK